MKNSINLNSNEWCDLVFEHKNKSYGAYALRQSSGKRHILALAIIIVLVAFISLLPTLISTAKASSNKDTEGIKDEYKITIIDVNKPDVDKPVIEVPEVEPPKLIKELKTVAFVPPVITSDEMVKEGETLKSVDDVLKTDAVVGIYDNPDGSLEPEAVPIEKVQVVEVEPKKDKVFNSVEIMPLFPGGEKEMYRFIGQNLKYPVSAQEANIQGKVVVRFVVDQNGSINDVEILRGIDPNCDKEALRVIKNMPKWVPGKQNGIPVKVYYTMPIVFRLS